MWMKRFVGVSSFVALAVLVTGAGCGENKAATEKCAESANGEGCKTCCTDNGATEYAFVSGDGCTCRK